MNNKIKVTKIVPTLSKYILVSSGDILLYTYRDGIPLMYRYSKSIICEKLVTVINKDEILVDKSSAKPLNITKFVGSLKGANITKACKSISNIIHELAKFEKCIILMLQQERDRILLGLSVCEQTRRETPFWTIPRKKFCIIDDVDTVREVLQYLKIVCL